MLPSDIANDSLIFDGGIAITLRRKRAGMEDPVVVRNATCGPLSNRQVFALGRIALVGTERSWSLAAADVGPAGVQPGDVIDDGFNLWTILSADLATLASRWRCAARRQA